MGDRLKEWLEPLQDARERTLYEKVIGLATLATILWWLGMPLYAEHFFQFGMSVAEGSGAPLRDTFGASQDLAFIVDAIAVSFGLAVVYRKTNQVFVSGWCFATIAGTGVAAAIALENDMPLGFTLMLPLGAVAVGILIHILEIPILWGPFRFRCSESREPKKLKRQTWLQISAMWGLFLFVIPGFISQLDFAQGWGQLYSPISVIAAGVILFAFFSVIGLKTASDMVAYGEGTPLPHVCAKKLVLEGSYRWVRNPMAISGIGQGIAVGLVLESPWAISYALAGAAMWHFAVRPLEEKDLEERFGESFRTYRDAVWCWIPRFKGFSPKNSTLEQA